MHSCAYKALKHCQAFLYVQSLKMINNEIFPYTETGSHNSSQKVLWNKLRNIILYALYTAFRTSSVTSQSIPAICLHKDIASTTKDNFFTTNVQLAFLYRLLRKIRH